MATFVPAFAGQKRESVMREDFVENKAVLFFCHADQRWNSLLFFLTLKSGAPELSKETVEEVQRAVGTPRAAWGMSGVVVVVLEGQGRWSSYTSPPLPSPPDSPSVHLMTRTLD